MAKTDVPTNIHSLFQHHKITFLKELRIKVTLILKSGGEELKINYRFASCFVFVFFYLKNIHRILPILFFHLWYQHRYPLWVKITLINTNHYINHLSISSLRNYLNFSEVCHAFRNLWYYGGGGGRYPIIGLTIS